MVITHVSANICQYTGKEPAELLGSDIAALFGRKQIEELLRRDLKPRPPQILQPWFVELGNGDGDTVRYECLPHQNGGMLIIELLQPDEGPADAWRHEGLRQRIISELILPQTVEDLANLAAGFVREVTGFDRVMVYRFAEDKHGQVIAESTNRPDSFMDMHYPSSDIPEPARRHFMLNLIRSISDINAVPVPVLTRGGDVAGPGSENPLDLTYSKLRGVAPVHVEYLNNMGVGASMSISLVSNDRLWGLIACHHYGALHLQSSCLRFCEMLGGTVSALLQNLENTNLLERRIDAEQVAFNMELGARDQMDLHATIRSHADRLLELTGSVGLMLRVGGVTSTSGDLPQQEVTWQVLSPLVEDGVAAHDRLGALTPLTTQQLQLASGAALVEISEDGEDCLVLFRPQYEHTIRWAGKPEKMETVGENGVSRLSPRGSFRRLAAGAIGMQQAVHIHRQGDTAHCPACAVCAQQPQSRARRGRGAKAGRSRAGPPSPGADGCRKTQRDGRVGWCAGARTQPAAGGGKQLCECLPSGTANYGADDFRQCHRIHAKGCAGELAGRRPGAQVAQLHIVRRTHSRAGGLA
jgi:chemotaxis family two-component system sensor kinase Cph1